METKSQNGLPSDISASDAAEETLGNFIPSNIRLLRKRHGWSQQELAERVGLNRGNIASYESGTAEPKICKLLRISQLFGLSSRDLTRFDLTQPGQLEQAMRSFQEEDRASSDRVDEALNRLNEYDDLSESISRLHRFKVKSLSTESGQDLHALATYLEQLEEINQKISGEYRSLLQRLRCHCK
ncbi:MAG: helix-turn-helix transcriptional regulator [Bacteroidota bacterium]